MEYKLKCDLPLAKAGTPINFFGNGSSDKINIEVAEDGTLKIWITDITRINEWVEEVKPREWWEMDCESPSPKFRSKSEVELFIKNNHYLTFKPIKVREVIE